MLISRVANGAAPALIELILPADGAASGELMSSSGGVVRQRRPLHLPAHPARPLGVKMAPSAAITLAVHAPRRVADFG